MQAPGTLAPGLPHLVILPGLDATGTQHAAFCAALHAQATTFARSPWRSLRAVQSLLYRAPVRLLPMPALSWWLLGRWSTPALRNALASALAKVDDTVLRTRAVAAIGVDRSMHAARLGVPTMCLHARHDRLLPVYCQRHLSRVLAAPVVRWMEGPHLLLQARPQAAADEVSRFLKTLA